MSNGKFGNSKFDVSPEFFEEAERMKAPIQSYVRNCTIVPKQGDNFPLFNLFTGIVRLDGYAVIPVDEYERLKTEANQ